MQLTISLDHRFLRTPDGSVWTVTTNPYAFWRRYLDVFDEVFVVARIREVTEPEPGSIPADGPGVSFVAVPNFQGLLQYATKYPGVRRAIRGALANSGAVIVRVPSSIGTHVARYLHRHGRPFAAEVVGDPWDVFSPGSIRHSLRPIIRRVFRRDLEVCCGNAIASAYVTELALQRRYPCPKAMVGVSDVELGPDAFVPSSRVVDHNTRPAKLLFVGTLAQLYKGPDTLIRALAAIAPSRPIELTIVGEGQFLAELRSLAQRLGLHQRCLFVGQLPVGLPVRRIFDDSNLFILPSRQEGLPRALVEAMARGLPCIGSAVGGIPELLSASNLVQPNDARALARKIEEVLDSPERMTAMSHANLLRAREFAADRLTPRRNEFYRYVETQTRTCVSKRIACCASDRTDPWPPGDHVAIPNTSHNSLEGKL